MTTHSYSVSAVVGGLDAWVLWDRRLQTYAAVLRLFAGAAEYPPPFSRHGTRPLEYPAPEALLADLAARGLPLAPASRAAIDELAARVEADEGVVEVVGLVTGDGCRRLFCLAPSGSVVELLPQFAHPEHRFTWGDRSPATYDTAAAIVRYALGPVAADELDVAAMGLVVEYLAATEGEFSLSVPGVGAWFLADAPLTATLRSADRRSLRRRLGLSADTRFPAQESSAAATPAGTGWSGLDRHR
ncbi:MAG: hypothetical protein AAFN30_06895 [Actinomycetota bacterium]